MRNISSSVWFWLILLIPILLCLNCQQPQVLFQKGIDQAGTLFLSAFEDEDRNLIVGSYQSGDSYLTKYNRNGGKVWSKKYPGYGNLQEALETSDGNYVMLGNLPNYLTKVDKDGNVIWSKRYSFPTSTFSYVRSYHLSEANDGGFIITGILNPYSVSGERLFLLKTDQSGTPVWGSWYEINDPAYQQISYGRSVITTQNGNFVVTGEVYHNTYKWEVLLLKVNGNGQPVSVGVTYGITSNANYTSETGISIKEVGNDFIISGHTGSFTVKDDILLLKADNNLGHIWSKTIGGPEREVENCLSLTDDGGFIIQGKTDSYSSGTDDDIYLLKTDASGDPEWFRVYGGSANEEVAHHHGILTPTETYDGGFAFVGTTNSFGFSGDAGYLVRTRKDGNVPCHQITPIPTNSQPDWYEHSVTFQQNAIAVTSSNGPSTVEDAQPQETSICKQNDCFNPPAGLTAWYPLVFQDKVLDIVGGNDAPASISNVSLTSGIVGLAINLDGANYKYDAPDNNAIDFGTGDFSIDFWIYADSDQASSLRTILDKRVGSPNFQGYSVFVQNGRIGLQLADGMPNTICSSNAVSYTNFLSSTNIANGQWHFVAITVDRNDPNGGKIYIDGGTPYIFNPTCRPASLNNNADLMIGQSFNGVGNSFKGKLDELEFFNRVLKGFEVQALYQAPPAGKCNTKVSVPSSTHFCLNAQQVIIPVYVCNFQNQNRTFELVTLDGLPENSQGANCTIDGPTSYTVLTSSLTLAPFTCGFIDVQVDRPADMNNALDRSCYQVAVKDDQGIISWAEGVLIDRRDICIQTSTGGGIGKSVVHLDPGQSIDIGFKLKNTTDSLLTATYEVVLLDQKGRPVKEQIRFTKADSDRNIKLPPGESMDIQVTGQWMAPSHLGFHEIILQARMNKEEIALPLSSIMIMPKKLSE